MAVDSEATNRAALICREIEQEFPRAVVFSGKRIFRRERWYHELRHDETAMSIQRRLQFEGCWRSPGLCG